MAKQPAEIIHICTFCNKTATKATIQRDFYKSYSRYHNKDICVVQLCKDCIKQFSVDGTRLNLDKLKDVLRYIDKPFIKVCLDGAITETIGELQKNEIIITPEDVINKYGDKIVIYYMKNVVMRQYQGLTWINGEFDNISIEQDRLSDFLITEEIRKYWGRTLQEWEIEFLEEEVIKLKTSFECPDYGMEMLMRDICFINLEIEKTRQGGKGDVTKLIDSRSKLMNDAKMKPIQATGAEANDQITFGMLIKKLENDKPTNEPLDEWKDPDNFEKWHKIFVGHIAEMNDIENDVVKEYREIIKPYSVSRDEDGDE